MHRNDATLLRGVGDKLQHGVAQLWGRGRSGGATKTLDGRTEPDQLVGAGGAAGQMRLKGDLLAVVDRIQRNAPSLRSRFASFVLDGASLGQYLKSINQLMED